MFKPGDKVNAVDPNNVVYEGATILAVGTTSNNLLFYKVSNGNPLVTTWLSQDVVFKQLADSDIKNELLFADGLRSV